MCYLVLEENTIQSEIILNLPALMIMICHDNMYFGLCKFRRKKTNISSWVEISLV